MKNARIRHRSDDIVVVGSGLAGLTCALALAPKNVTVISKTPRLEGGSSLWAQGGIAAAVGTGDSPEAHAADTLSAGAGLSDPDRVRDLTGEGAASLQWLLDEGIPFDRDRDGRLQLAREGAHRFPRVVHAGGDTTGNVLMRSLIASVAGATSIEVISDTFASDLIVRGGALCGLLTHSEADGWVVHKTSKIVLATGGIGMAWQRTTNPAEATGDGLAMAARAGARLADMEFVQFHPTALAAGPEDCSGSLPLLTEALRGAGALLLDDTGHRFMPSVHPAAELAPRDVVAREIDTRIRRGRPVYLDIRPVLDSKGPHVFPAAVAAASEAGVDPFAEPLPVVPAAHYHMGGVQVDSRGRTSVKGLWACGEVATTGVHGANRLASNSLLEAVALARRVAADVASRESSTSGFDAGDLEMATVPDRAGDGRRADLLPEIRKLMSNKVGILRNGDALRSACAYLEHLADEFSGLSDGPAPEPGQVRSWGEARNLLLVARLVALAALRRTESRGAHYRNDFPSRNRHWEKRQILGIEHLAATSANSSRRGVSNAANVSSSR